MGTVIMEKENMQQIYSVEADSYDCIGCAIAKGELTPPGGTIYESRNIVLAADPEVPIPGFLIITGRRHVNSFSMLYKEEWMEIGEVISKAERAIKNLGLAQEITLVQEERSKHFHIWIFPTKDWMIEKFGRGVSSLRDISRYAMENATGSDWEEVEEAVREIRAEFYKGNYEY
jgi:diadenosine tetraphosphate (Ap4A) HIT family hydrolase